MFANAIFFHPEPNWEWSTPLELVIWGVSLSLAALLFGAGVAAAAHGGPPRRGCSLMMAAFVLFIVGMGAAERGHVRKIEDRLQRERERLEREKGETKPADKQQEGPTQ